MSEVIYVPLAGEDNYFRPVHADHVADDVYEITVDLEPKGERWVFPPRSLVRCRPHTFVDGTTGLLAYAPVEHADCDPETSPEIK